MLKSKISLISILAILSFSTFIPALAYAAPTATSARDWQHVNGNSWAWNYSPQTQINKDNVEDLEVKWIYPIGGKQSAPAVLQALQMDVRSTAPPIVVNGIAYVLTGYKSIVAIDAKTGKELWEHQYLLDIEAAKARLPVIIDWVRHSHGFRYWEAGDMLINPGQECDIYGVNAKTGDEEFRIPDLCLNIPGNIYQYRAYFFGTRATAEIATYEKGRQFIYVLPGRIHSTPNQVAPGDARHVTLGVSMDPPYAIQWRVYSFPPQDRLSKDWALDECEIGFFREIPCSEVAAVNREGLEWDQTLPGELPGWYAGVTGNWGQPVIDVDTFMLYTLTVKQGTFSNMSLVPCPRLYGSTIMAIDMNAGKRAWWLQPFPHDPYDYDCNWSGMLVDNPTLGKVYIKGCKEGVFYVMDAATGEPKYAKDVRDDQYARGQISTDPHTLIYEPDPKSYHDMREWNWISWPATAPGEPGEHFTLPATIYPHWGNGIFGSDMSFDPETQTLILYEVALQVDILEERGYQTGGSLFSTRSSPIKNTSIVARDLATGDVKWTWFYAIGQQRAAMVVSSDLVFTGFTDGFMRFIDKNTGALLHEMNLGSTVTVGVTTGQDSDGNQKIFAIVGASGAVPGTLVVVGLSDRAAAEVKTTTVTTTTTSRTTLTSTTTTSITTTATTTQTVTSTTTRVSTTTATSTTTLATTSTVVSTAAPSTTTVTSEITETTGLPATVTYAAVAVAVIAIIGAAVLATRKK